MKILFIIGLYFITSVACLGQATEWVKFNKNNSKIPSNLVTQIIIDKYNNKWITAMGETGQGNGGLAKFDGTNWQVYNTNTTGVKYQSFSNMVFDSIGTIYLLYNGKYIYKFKHTFIYTATIDDYRYIYNTTE